MSLNALTMFCEEICDLLHFLLAVWADVWSNRGQTRSVCRTLFHRDSLAPRKVCVMGIELRRQRDGSLRPTWYGRHEVNGKRNFVNLGVKVLGTPPASLMLRDQGDAAFERSRATALAKLESLQAEAQSRQGAERLVERLYEMKTGEKIKSVRLAELGQEWAGIPRKHAPNERYASQCQSTLKRFAAFVRQENPKAMELAHVSRTVARAFMDAEAERGVTGKTWNDTLKLLRATCKYLLPAGSINPFSDMPTKDTETVFRKPFSPEELKKIVEAAHDDDFIRPIIVTGICTAMRRGDCCLLKWEDVDLERRFITVKTAKTGVTVSIPIFPMLRLELEALTSPRPSPRRGEGGRTGYVFPEAARMYLENPDGITWRVKKVLAGALAVKDEGGGMKDEGQTAETAETENRGDGETEREGQGRLPEVAEEEARRRGLEYIATLDNVEKRERMATVFSLYMDRKPSKELAAAAGVSKGSVSGYLNEIEAAVGCRIVRGRAEGGSLTAMLKTDTSLLCTEVEGRTRAASVRDFHSFRVTWVTLALTAGVPLELVQKVTGHKTAEIVLKHYFQPGREDFRKALNAAMPKLLTNGTNGLQDDGTTGLQGKSTEGGEDEPAKRGTGETVQADAGKGLKEQIREIASGASGKDWKKEKARILELLTGI